MKDYLLAALLITTSPEVIEDRVPTSDEWVVLQNSLQGVAVEWQLMDKRETTYIFARREDYGVDLQMIRLRYVDLKDAPKVEDSDRFPPREWVTKQLTFNRAFRKKMMERIDGGLENDRVGTLTQVVKETDQLYQVWDLVRDGECVFYYVTVRRLALKRLRDLIGREAYEAADLPPFVPHWRFNDLR